MSINSVSNDLASTVNFINAQKPIPPTISGYSVGGLDDTALDPAGGQTVQINGTGFLPGATITFDGSAVAVVTYVNPNQLTFTSPAKSAGTYTIYVVNADGGTAIYIPGIIYSLLPTWTTAAGSLGSYYETQSIANTVVASGDAPITYSLFSGSLPTGATLAANGVITGTAPVDSSSTTYSFTIQASDAQLQDSTRSFSLTINTDVVTWVSPANNTTYTSTANSAIANVTLSATDAAGYAVSYSANALPTGLSLSGANITGTPTVVADSSTLLTATAATTNRTATRTINWSITVANDPYFEYNTLLIPGASTTFVDDASTNNFAVTINGDTKPNNFNPYTPGYYSNYFDGSGDYLSVPSNAAFDLGAGDFTIEFWFNSQSFATAYGFISRYNYAASTGSGSGWGLRVINSTTLRFIYGNEIVNEVTVSLNTISWYHLAVSRSGTTAKLFLNGTQVGSFTVNNFSDASSALQIGRTNTLTDDAYAYISNVRIVKGTAVYTSAFTPSTTPLTAIANTSLLTCQSNRFIDNSTNNFTITVFGNTTVNSFDPFVPNSSYSTYGSGYFDGTGDYINTPANAVFTFGTGDLTLECWIYQTATSVSTYRVIFGDNVYGSTGGYTLYSYNNALNLWKGGGEVIAPAGTITLNAWNHVAWTRSGSSNRLFINGTQVGATTTDATNYTSTISYIGASVAGTFPFAGYITDVRIVKGTAVYTTTFTPPTAPLTAISGTSLLTLQNNQSVNNNIFLDNSTNNFFVTRNGNTTQGTFSPYGGNWSNYFDGTGDYLTCVGTGAVVRASGSFTIEGWYYPTSSDVSYRAVYSSGTGYETAGRLYQYGTQVVYYTSGSQSGEYGSVSWTINTWNHFAVTWNGTTTKIYINGQLSNTNTLPYSGTTNLSVSEATYTALGYISNFRITSSVLYTSNFTPSTTPLTPTTGTILLTCQSNRIVDTSINNFTVTKNGDVSVQRFSPFNPSSLTPTSYSGYFDGSGDYLSLPSNSVFSPGTSAFTIEFWYYPVTSLTNAGIFDTRTSSTSVNGILVRQGDPSGLTIGAYLNNATFITSGTLLNLNAWNHVAIVRNSSNSVVTYVNGIGGTGTTISNNLTDGTSNTPFIGRFVDTSASPYAANGYISNFRMVKGVAVYTGNFTVPTSPLQSTQSSGTNIAAITGTATSLLTLQSTSFVDNSTNNFTVSAFGNSQPTQQNPFGYTSATTNGYTVSTIGGSGYFDGSGDYLTAPSNAAYQFGTGNFTIEYWIYQTASGSYRTVLDTRSSGTASPWACLINSSNQPYILITSDLTSSIAININTWNHVAIVRSGTNLSIYVNGVSGLSTTNSTSISPTGSLRVGLTVDAVYPMLGYLTDIRVINGTALYTSNFVPLSAPLTALQNSSLLLNMTSAGIYDAAMMNNLETVGDAKLSTAVSKFGGSSMYFDGTGDYLSSLGNPYLVLGTGDFTIECWFNVNSTTNNGLLHLAATVFPASVTGVALYIASNNISMYCAGAASPPGGAISTGVWYHVAMVRYNGVTKLYLNGTYSSGAGSVTDTTNYTGSALAVGGYYNSTLLTNGYIDDLRITKGYARYTSNFTAPTSAFPIY